jgi:hypothetical protein
MQDILDEQVKQKKIVREMKQLQTEPLGGLIHAGRRLADAPTFLLRCPAGQDTQWEARGKPVTR